MKTIQSRIEGERSQDRKTKIGTGDRSERIYLLEDMLHKSNKPLMILSQNMKKELEI